MFQKKKDEKDIQNKANSVELIQSLELKKSFQLGNSLDIKHRPTNSKYEEKSKVNIEVENSFIASEA
jgi:hypothetical protein